jgi:hypothetical protein
MGFGPSSRAEADRAVFKSGEARLCDGRKEMDEQQVDEVQPQELPAEVPAPAEDEEGDIDSSALTDEMDDEADDAAAANTAR